jgi:hypothetical protein
MTRTFHAAGLGLVALITFALTILPVRNVRSQGEQQGGKPSPLEGAWKVIEPKLPEGLEQIKFVTGGRFVWVAVQDGRIQSALGGKYTVDQEKYTESIEYSHGEFQRAFVGKTGDFTWKIDDNIWLLAGTVKLDDRDIKINEKWERCK